MRRLLAVMAIAFCTTPLLAISKETGRGVNVITQEGQRRVDITINGELFTSYVWPTSLDKPVLYPLVSPDGVVVTRGFPLDPWPGERTDHPHHAGLWFDYGNVNGFDFWNNSTAIPPADRPKMGSIRQEKIVSTRSGAESGELVVECVWVAGDSTPQIRETTRFVFSHRKGVRTIDRITTLKALKDVVFHDDKEGLFGMRVAHFLESPTEKSGVYNDANGRPTKVASADTSGATGVYRTSEGVIGDKVWGTRGRWCTLTGEASGHHVSVAIIDNPRNPGYPTYWHARGYGLFAANPLGRSIFDPKATPMNLSLKEGDTATFRYRVEILSHDATDAEMNHDADDFAAAYK